jgi:hypothetical protein
MSKKAFRPDVDAPEWRGRYSPYDIIKEGTIAIVIVGLLTILLATFFGSPDERAITMKTWSNADPVDFALTTVSELNGTSTTAGYGAPYNTASEGVKLGPISLGKFMGVTIPIDPVKDFIVNPLRSWPNQPTLTQALSTWTSASSSTQSGWVNSYTKASSKLSFANGHIMVNALNAGPLTVMIDDLTQMAQSGALDQALVAGAGFYTTNYTKPLMFLADSGYFANLADKQHLTGTQWGMMNETGQYPGQAWLWLYTFWYQIPPFTTSSNADILVFAVMAILSVGLFLLPLIPGLRAIPRKSKVYRLIWREHYKNLS